MDFNLQSKTSIKLAWPISIFSYSAAVDGTDIFMVGGRFCNASRRNRITYYNTAKPGQDPIDIGEIAGMHRGHF